MIWLSCGPRPQLDEFRLYYLRRKSGKKIGVRDVHANFRIGSVRQHVNRKLREEHPQISQIPPILFKQLTAHSLHSRFSYKTSAKPV